jgi:hypothetical protein
MRNKYCSNCLSTQRFLDLGACLVCERCSKRLERLEPPRPTRPEGRIVPWTDRYERPTGRREAM